MNIVLLEPYFTGSHASWAHGLRRNSSHHFTILGLNGRYWKWRMHGGAVTLARNFLEREIKADLLLATDMLDLTTFLALTRQVTASVRTVLYFHENQITYPWSPSDRDRLKQRDLHYGFINYASALAADAVFFNSRYHFHSFIEALPRFLKSFPDNNESDTVHQITSKSSILPLGMDLEQFDAYRDEPREKLRTNPPLILWNHRWEYDKNPEEFFALLSDLDREGVPFEVAVLGECFAQKPGIFLEAREKLKGRIVQFGFVDSAGDYAAWLWKADIVPITSVQDFFGASLIEAMYCNCYPLLPRRLAYPEHIPEELHSRFFYNDYGDLGERLKALIANIKMLRRENVQHLVEQYDWKNIASRYDSAFEAVANGDRP